MFLILPADIRSPCDKKMIHQKIGENLEFIQTAIESATRRSGRPAGSVELVAVTKYAEKEWVQALIDLGVRSLGESRPQQLARRADEFSDGIHWHLIGHLQRNKVDMVLPVTTLIHSVDSLRLLRKISASADRAGRTQSVLLEVNVSGETAKDGLSPDSLREQWHEFRSLPGIQIDGLMTMAPRSADPESTRPVFRSLRELRDELAADGDCPLAELSMGMSGDFEVAIEEGATLVRIGSSLFDGLTG